MYRVTVEENKFSTFEVSNSAVIEASHMYITTKSQRELIADDLFQFINTVYDELGGFKSFKDIQRFIDDSYLWYITYDGKQPDSLQDFDIRKVLVVSVFRRKNGLKMVGLAKRMIAPDERNKQRNTELKRNANAAVLQHIKFIIKIGWAEVSGKLETFFANALTIHDIIDPYDLKSYKVFKNIDIELDQFHYTRPLRKDEEPIRKIAYGKIKF